MRRARTHRRRLAAAVIVAWVGLGALARAEERSAEEDPAYETRVHGARLRHRQPADDPAGFSSVVEIRDPTPGTRLPELLAEVPGLRIKQRGPFGGQSLSLRGADSQQTVVYLDGIRLTPPGGGAVDLSLLDPAHLELAEVRRSGGSARFGAGALGGVLLLKTPRLRMRSRTSAAVGYGSQGAVVLRAARGATLGDWRYLASGSYQRGDGDFPYVDDNGVARRRDNNDFDAGELLLKADRLGRRWHLVLLNSLGGAARGAPGMSQRPSASARQRDLRNHAGARLSRRGLLRGDDELRLSLFHSYRYFRFDEPDPPRVAARSHRLGFGGGASWTLPLGDVGRLHAGVEARGDLLRDAELTEQPVRGAGDLWLASQSRLAGGALVIAPAVRLALATGFAPAVVPKLGLVLRPLRFTGVASLAALEVTANVGRSYRLPSFAEMYVRLEGFSGNVELRPEDALAGDVGLRWRGATLSVEGAYFHRLMSNTILFAPVSPVMVRPDNFSGVRVQGVEGAVGLEPGLCLQLRGAYTYTRTRFGEPASRLPGHPTHRVVGRLAWIGRDCGAAWRRRGAGRWLAGLRLWVQVVGEGAMVLGRFESLPEEGRVLLSAGGAYRYRFLRLALEGRNLLDKRDAVDTVGFPLPPARLFASLSATF